MTAGAKVQAKVFLPGDVVRALDEASRRLRRSKSEIVRAAVASYLSADGAEAGEAAVTRRLDRMSRQIERLERDLTIANEAVALFVRTWLRNTPSIAAADEQAAADAGRERYLRFVEALARRLGGRGRLLREQIAQDHLGEGEV